MRHQESSQLLHTRCRNAPDVKCWSQCTERGMTVSTLVLFRQHGWQGPLSHVEMPLRETHSAHISQRCRHGIALRHDMFCCNVPGGVCNN